jgi:hypothetical protein
MDLSKTNICSSNWPSSPPIFASSSTNEIDEFSLFIPNISLNELNKNQSNQYISIYCRENEVNDFIKRGFIFVYSINSRFSNVDELTDFVHRSEAMGPGPEKRYYKMIKRV